MDQHSSLRIGGLASKNQQQQHTNVIPQVVCTQSYPNLVKVEMFLITEANQTSSNAKMEG